MINLAETQTVSDVCRSCNFADGTTCTYRIDDARDCYVVYRMKISVISNAVVLDLYNY